LGSHELDVRSWSHEPAVDGHYRRFFPCGEGGAGRPLGEPNLRISAYSLGGVDVVGWWKRVNPDVLVMTAQLFTT